MSQQLTGYRVFIASPGGLSSARDGFRRVLEEYNRTDGFRRGVVFIPVGWEKMAPTRGRGQEVINQRLRQCDFCVLVLHDRWGTPPSDDGPFTSGTEEEFNVAMACLRSNDHAMEDVVVQFKSIEPGQLSDPGPQLRKVLEFKQKLEDSRELLFGTFEAEEDFAESLRMKLADWVWNHENPNCDDAPEPTNSAQVTADEVASDGGTDPLERAAHLISQRRFTLAETILAAAAGSRDNPAADIAYAELLASMRQRHQAEASFERGIELSAELGDKSLEARGLLGLGRLYESMGKGARTKAIAAFEGAIARYQALDLKRELAESWMALGVSRRNLGEFDDALTAYEQAAPALEDLNRSDLEVLFHLGRGEVYRDLNRLVDAKADFERAIALKADNGLEDDAPDAFAGLGAICEALGDLDVAEGLYRRSLGLFSTRRNWIGVADVADHLGHIFEQRNNFPEALDAFERSAEAFEILQNSEAAADAYLSRGRISELLDDPVAARRHYDDALALVNRMHKGPLATDMSAQLIARLDALGAAVPC